MTWYRQYSDYELCSLYSDYHEWLEESGWKFEKSVKDRYRHYMREILAELGRRHGGLNDG